MAAKARVQDRRVDFMAAPFTLRSEEGFPSCPEGSAPNGVGTQRFSIVRLSNIFDSASNIPDEVQANQHSFVKRRRSDRHPVDVPLGPCKLAAHDQSWRPHSR